MKSTEIPNGFMILGEKGNLLVDLEDGKVTDTMVEVEVSGWPDTMMNQGRLKSDLLILVHSVKGESQTLLKRLWVSGFKSHGKPVCVRAVIHSGKLKEIVEANFKQYMDLMREKEKGKEKV